MEKDDEIKGEGNSYDFGARMLDPRLGRWLTIDPMYKGYSDVSPYSQSNNNPVLYIDIEGRKWINVHEERIKELNQQILDNPNDAKLIEKLNKQIEKEQKKADQINQIINTVKANDYYLWSYIDNLQVSDPKTGECVDVNVRVEMKTTSDAPSPSTRASTSYYNNLDKGRGGRKYMKYESIEKFNVEKLDPLNASPFAFTCPINSENEIGFNIEFYYNSDLNDIRLSNEIGDVMFRMEYPKASKLSGDDVEKEYEDYAKYGTSGGYSFMIDGFYENRKTTGEGKNLENPSPYPLENTEDNYKQYSGQ